MMSSKDNTQFSIEFYPPRTAEGGPKLDAVHAELARLNPGFFSITYGAGGSTRDGTRSLALKYTEAGSSIAPHLSFGGSDEAEVAQLLQDYKAAGITRLVALRGDLPSGSGSVKHYRYASELIEFIRAKTGDHFHIEVACYPEMHPEARNLFEDIEYFRQKVDSGADSAITQYFYNADAYFYFVDYCRGKGIDIPIVPGIMPITNYDSLARFSRKCGAEIPRWLDQRLLAMADDPEGLKEFGAEVVTGLCQRLLDGGAPGLHFYSMNLARPTQRIWENLALSGNNRSAAD